MSQDWRNDRLRDEMVQLGREVEGVRGVLVATTDGHAITHTMPDDDGDTSLSTAAMIAALLGIGQRLAQLTGDPDLREATITSGSGTVVIYAVGRRAVMTVLTEKGVNLARLHLAARRRVRTLAGLVDLMTSQQHDAVGHAGPGTRAAQLAAATGKDSA